jgi:hypothetical protein
MAAAQRGEPEPPHELLVGVAFRVIRPEHHPGGAVGATQRADAPGRLVDDNLIDYGRGRVFNLG